MMRNTSVPFDTLLAGFGDPVHDAQRVFRVLLDALARPGTCGTLDIALDPALAPRPAAAYAALLALADYGTPVWLAAADDVLAQSVRFHTGAPLAQDPGDAAFAYVADAALLPPPAAFAGGTPEAPQDSATVFVRVDALSGGRPLVLSGPGIASHALIAPVGLPDTFWDARAALAKRAPCGIDCYLICADAVIGIPRTTRVEWH
jgi:alpha-D-ribose 1-methylphosphonate 5-triphosphate synthase subunit PhnH